MEPDQLFLHRRIEKYRRGIDEHRGGDVTQPFAGDLFEEYAQEQLDSANYVDEMAERGMISREEADYALAEHFKNWWWAVCRQTGETL